MNYTDSEILDWIEKEIKSHGVFSINKYGIDWARVFSVSSQHALPAQNVRQAINNAINSSKNSTEQRRKLFHAKQKVLHPTVPQPKQNLPKEGFGSVYDQQDRIDLEERDK